MRMLFPYLLSLLLAFSSEEAPAAYEELLSKYVKKDGVNYKDWHANQNDLDGLKKVVNYYATATEPKNEKVALSFYLNAYNAWILERILDKYPVKGPLSGGDLLFFHKKSFKVCGKKMSFDTLEQKLIRPRFKESRIHFALNCASKSCPPLRNEPYRAATLDQQLNEQTYAFLHDETYGVKHSGETATFSKIFEWYAEDFGGEKNIPQWVNYYRKPSLPTLTAQSFMSYDWSLNEAQP